MSHDKGTDTRHDLTKRPHRATPIKKLKKHIWYEFYESLAFIVNIYSILSVLNDNFDIYRVVTIISLPLSFNFYVTVISYNLHIVDTLHVFKTTLFVLWSFQEKGLTNAYDPFPASELFLERIVPEDNVSFWHMKDEHILIILVEIYVQSICVIFERITFKIWLGLHEKWTGSKYVWSHIHWHICLIFL